MPVGFLVPPGSVWYPMEIGRWGVKPELCGPGGFAGSLMVQNICWMVNDE